MRKRFLLSLLVALLTTLSTHAYNFKSGDLYYNITSDNTVEVTYQEQWSESNYRGLTTATIPETVTNNGTTYSVTSIGETAFAWCSALTSITLPNSVTSIVGGAFYGCSSLTSITIPNSVTSIGYRAFYECSSLTSITLPNSVTSIGEYAFYGCTSLPVEDNLRYVDTYLVEAVDESLSTYTIKAGTKWIGDDAFRGCSSLTSITIPNSVTSIGWSAFYGCSSLTSFTLPNSVTSIGGYAFKGCSSLTSITLPNSVTSIETYAFEDCSSLTSVVWNAKNCAGWTSESSYAPFYYIRSNITSFTFGEEVETIPSYLCYGMSSLTSITIPNSVTSIGNYAFSDCSSLTSVVWNAKNCVGWQYAHYAPFDDISANITSFTFGEEVETIPSYLCYGMSSLTSITLPNSVTSIESSAFNGCSSLTKTNYTGDLASWCAISFESNPTFYSHNLYINDVEVKDLVTFPETVTSIGGQAFSGCTSITSLNIPNSVISIGGNAFYRCSLTDIYCYATTPPVCDGSTNYGTFEEVSKHCYIHVPAGTIRDYQMAAGWSDFYHFYEISELPDGAPTDQVGVTVTGNYATFSWPVNPTASSYTLTITKDGEVFCTLIFNNMGQLVGMAFAPARNGEQSANQGDAQSTAYGFSFVVTNLDANSHYTYTFTVNGADNEVIETYSGTFDTTEDTALSETEQQNKPSRKIIRNGQVLILRNGVAYDMMGNML